MTRSARAKQSHVPMNGDKYQLSKLNEKRLAVALQGETMTDITAAFDVLTEFGLIEQKTIIEGVNDKITVHPDSKKRKLRVSRRLKLPCFTVVFDERGARSRIYVRRGVGSYRLHTMNEVGSLSRLQEWFTKNDRRRKK